VQQLNRLVDTQRNHLAAMEDIAQAGGDSQSVASNETLPSLR
jgi:hypothetical protein